MENQPVELPLTCKFSWRIEKISTLKTSRIYSDVFKDDGYHKWRILIFPNGNGNGTKHLSIYLDSASVDKCPNVEFSLAVINQIHNNETVRKETKHQFTLRESDWGFTRFMPLSDLNGLGSGYIVDDTCIVEAEVTFYGVMENSTKGLSGNSMEANSMEAEQQVEVPSKVVAPVAEKDPDTASVSEPETQTKLDEISKEQVVVEKASVEVTEPAMLVECAVLTPDKVTLPALTTQSGEIAPLPVYPGAGQLFEDGQHRQGVLDEKFEDIGGFSVLKTQVPLYKQIWLKYGHIASSHILTASYSLQVTLVTEIMTSVLEMHQHRLDEVSSAMIYSWEDKIKMGEKLEFNIRWLRERFEDVKKDFYEEHKLKTALTEQDKSLQVAMARLIVAKDDLKKVQENLSALETMISPLLPERQMNLGKGSSLLFDGLF